MTLHQERRNRERRNRAKNRKKRKICRHSPSCNKVLAYSTRLRHYRYADLNRIQDSLSPESSGNNGSEEDVGSSVDRSPSTYLGTPSLASSASSTHLSTPSAHSSPPPISHSSGSESGSDENTSDIIDYGYDQEPSSQDVFDDGDRVALDEMLVDLKGMMGPEGEAELWRLRNKLISDSDRDNVRAFRLKMYGNITRRSFNQMRYTFRHKLEIDSEWVMLRRMGLLAAIEPKKIDCCIKSCIAYTGKYQLLEECPFCHQPRFTRDRRIRRSFNYIPLVPQIRAFFQNPAMIQKMGYRHRFRHDPSCIRDVFDSTHYRNLLHRKVVVDGVERPYNHFSDPRDIAFALSVDGYLLFKRRRSGPKAVPIILQNYNLSPRIRTHLENIICLGVVHNPKDLGSFLEPVNDELVQLALGVTTFDAAMKELFNLHAYLILKNGDSLVVNDFLGVRMVTQGGSNYYVPLITPGVENEDRPSVDPRQLPLRTHRHFLRVHEKIKAAETSTLREAIGFHYGIRHFPLISRVSSIDFAVSFPWEWLHIFSENVVQHVVNLVSGKFKLLDAGHEEYELSEKTWKQIGLETAQATQDIPASYIRTLGNINERSHYTAESWAFWIMYVAPIVLQDRFSDDKYYEHICLLGKIMKTTLRHELTMQDINELEEDIIQWVELYEEFYYQYQEHRLPTCVSTIHGLLHIANDIRNAGPCWATWTFWTERFCGILQAGLHSRRAPAANLDKRVLHMAYLRQLENKYDLADELSAVEGRRLDELTRGEIAFPEYPDQVLRPPCVGNYEPDTDLRRRISHYFASILGQNQNEIAQHLPRFMPMYERMRIRHGGDAIRTGTWIRRHMKTSQTFRNNSYVRYEVAFGQEGEEQVNTIGYGVLEKILFCGLDGEGPWSYLGNTSHLLAVITPWRTNGEDAALETLLFKHTLAPIVTDLRNVRGVVGRVESRGQWGIIDRNTAAFIHPTFVDEVYGQLDLDSDPGFESDSDF